ncbi:MAG: GspH/FimT family protein [Sedimenticolaceae bacterium]
MDVDNTLPRIPRGLTLVELTTTLAVAGISLAILLPSWAALAGRSQVTTAANQLLTHLRYARNEAVMRNQKISLCPSDDGDSCSGDPQGWQRGYLIFIDHDGDRERTPDEVVLRVQGPQAPGLRLHSTAGRPAIRFRGDGAAWSTNTTFSICQGEDSEIHRAVVLYGSGRARVDQRAPDNRPITCN